MNIEGDKDLKPFHIMVTQMTRRSLSLTGYRKARRMVILYRSPGFFYR
ncbi:MAG: hypothetical protein HFH07_08110 [Dorea sp.]|nr:hypothetical protein [Dorea sp.]